MLVFGWLRKRSKLARVMVDLHMSVESDERYTHVRTFMHNSTNMRLLRRVVFSEGSPYAKMEDGRELQEHLGQKSDSDISLQRLAVQIAARARRGKFEKVRDGTRAAMVLLCSRSLPSSPPQPAPQRRREEGAE